MAKKAESRSLKKPHSVAEGIVPRHSLLLTNSLLLNMPGTKNIVSRNCETIPRPVSNVVS
jgi:hypothetical protein